MPVREKGEGVPVRSLRVPSHVPRQPQTAAKVRGFSPIASGFTAETDWLLEEMGFEPLVPPFIMVGRAGRPALLSRFHRRQDVGVVDAQLMQTDVVEAEIGGRRMQRAERAVAEQLLQPRALED